MEPFGITTNSITGAIPDTLGTWTALTSFYAWENFIVIISSRHHWKLAQLESLVSETIFVGSLPEVIDTVDSLDRFLHL